MIKKAWFPLLYWKKLLNEDVLRTLFQEKLTSEARPKISVAYKKACIANIPKCGFRSKNYAFFLVGTF